MSHVNASYLQATPLLDFDSPSIQTLIAEKEWQSLTTSERIGAIYHFVQNEIAFGYNKRDDIAASWSMQYQSNVVDGTASCYGYCVSFAWVYH
jgi:transglutaminase-like putative cysteine protease